MSVATVQFAEMVWEAMNVSVSGNSPVCSVPGQVFEMFCEFCGLVSEHFLDDRGEWEIYTCASCGNKKSYKVK